LVKPSGSKCSELFTASIKTPSKRTCSYWRVNNHNGAKMWKCRTWVTRQLQMNIYEIGLNFGLMLRIKMGQIRKDKDIISYGS